ncbi:MAG: glycosyltransferase family 2 protein [Coriobacteriales bacterium]|jgi:glycosyltransferase involved in cell wall biosynthesis|nr:glycosyltransferase family 2 protein [Coriobacteriales bacterium]
MSNQEKKTKNTEQAASNEEAFQSTPKSPAQSLAQAKTTYDKVITFVVPCYNSAAYMDNCIASLIGAGARDLSRIEILIVDDGSTKDDTPERADAWVERFPDVVRVIHQPNGGHGEAVNTGIYEARGFYLKCVDSDDWVDVQAAQEVIDHLDEFTKLDEPVDMLVTNYVYNHRESKSEKIISFRSVFPRDKVFGWDDIGRFRISQNLLMHAVTYRTQLLRDINLRLPKHTFYVDNIFVYVPLPKVERLYYLDANLYQYFIGREDQSVNEKIVLKNIEQQLLITHFMIDAVRLPEDVPSRKLLNYMLNHLTLMIAVCTTFSILAHREQKLINREHYEMWHYLKEKSPKVYWRMRLGIRGIGTSLPTPAGRTLTIIVYRVAQRLYKFN